MKLLYCMFHLFFRLKKMHVASLQDQKIIHNNYNNMIQVSLRSHCIVLHLCSICIFLAESKSPFIAREKMNTNLTGLILLPYSNVIICVTKVS